MSTLLRDGSQVEDPRLDRIPSRTTEHFEKYPLTSSTMPDKPTPVAGGFDWHSSFDEPIRVKISGHWRYVIGAKPMGPIRGGHAVCFRPWTVKDTTGWYYYYDQGLEGRCTEFSKLRLLSLMNRKRYDITSKWHYWEAQRTDEWAGGSYPGAIPSYEGSSVRAALEVLRAHGAIPQRLGGKPISAEEAPSRVKPEEGIKAYRWLFDWGQMRSLLGIPDNIPGIPFLNSWADGYPKEVLLLDDIGQRLMDANGEFGVVTDR